MAIEVNTAETNKSKKKFKKTKNKIVWIIHNVIWDKLYIIIIIKKAIIKKIV